MEWSGRRPSRIGMLIAEREMLVMETGAVWILEEASGCLSSPLSLLASIQTKGWAEAPWDAM